MSHKQVPEQIVTATYHSYLTFKVPRGIDLNDTSRVVEHWVKYGTLYIKMWSGRIIEVTDGEVGDPDYKYPHEENVELAEHYDMDTSCWPEDTEMSEDEDEENEEEEEEEQTATDADDEMEED